jgi:predicted nucleic acid-binding protein
MLFALAEPVEMRFLWRPQLRDPGDEMVLETAANGRATSLVLSTRGITATFPASLGLI